MRRLTALVCFVLTACAATPDCDPEMVARRAVEEGVTRDGLREHGVGCEGKGDALRRAYDEALAEHCDPARAWDAAYGGSEPDALCRAEAGRTWIQAARLGARLSEFEQRLETVEEDMQRLDEGSSVDHPHHKHELRRLRVEAQRLTREIEQIRGIALIRGWIPQPQR